MAKEKAKGITVKKEEDMPEWYEQVVIKGEIAEHAPVKGCMIIRPSGFTIWQNIVDFFDAKIKKMGVKNAYFPMFIPEEFFHKEAEHASGFNPEVAWIEKKGEDKGRYAIRPTSETIIYDSYAKWIRSWRDLPLRMNQWCNICRWEVQDCKLFLRSREFLWQEGHCVYETEEECEKEVLAFLEEYRKVAEELLAMPVIKGRKTDKERFAGAKRTYTIETLMPDGKALQLGTSHNLGQGFAKAFGIEYLGKDEKKHLPWQSSWGISTRMVGATIMMHSDNKGLVLPPRVAPLQVVIVPILFDDTKDKVLKECGEIMKSLKKFTVELDDREEYKPGWKFNEWEMKGVPLRIEFGPKDMENKQCVVARRDNGEKETVKLKDLSSVVDKTLDDIQKSLFNKAKKFMDDNTVEVDNWKDFEKAIKQKKIIKVPFSCEVEDEEEIKFKTKGATSRAIPLDLKPPKDKKCFFSGKPAKDWVYFAKNY